LLLTVMRHSVSEVSAGSGVGSTALGGGAAQADANWTNTVIFQEQVQDMPALILAAALCASAATLAAPAFAELAMIPAKKN
jgi:hypothetical protein